MPNASNNESTRSCDDPLVVHSLYEAKWIVAIWFVTFLWVVGYCSRFGYYREGEAISTIFGMPSWVFWGVALPWAAATIVSSWFALYRIADDPLVDRVDAERSENG